MINDAKAKVDQMTAIDRYRLKLSIQRRTPLLIWVGVLILTVGLFVRQEQGVKVMGVAMATSFNVAPETTGRLHRLEVRLNQDVQAGQIVASLDDRQLRLELSQVQAELERLAHQLGRERSLWNLEASGQLSDIQTNIGRFSRNASDAHIEYLQAVTELSVDQINLQQLQLNLSRTRIFEEQNIASQTAFDEARIAFQALQEKIEKEETTVATLLGVYQDAQARFEEMQDSFGESGANAEFLFRPLESSIQIQQIRIEMASLAMVNNVLRAPAAGRVAAVFRNQGEVVDAGQPVIAIQKTQATELVAYLPEYQILEIEPGSRVYLRRVADPGKTIISTVADLGPKVEQIPQRHTPLSQSAAWGRPVYIPLPASLEAKPGEAFEISF